MLVLSPKAFAERAGLVSGLPWTHAAAQLFKSRLVASRKRAASLEKRVQMAAFRYI